MVKELCFEVCPGCSFLCKMKSEYIQHGGRSHNPRSAADCALFFGIRELAHDKVSRCGHCSNKFCCNERGLEQLCRASNNASCNAWFVSIPAGAFTPLFAPPPGPPTENPLIIIHDS